MPKPTLAFNNPPDWSRLRVLKWVVPAVFVMSISLSSFYTVPPDSQGVVLRFGRFHSIEAPGLHFKLPLGIDFHDAALHGKLRYRPGAKIDWIMRTLPTLSSQFVFLLDTDNDPGLSQYNLL